LEYLNDVTKYRINTNILDIMDTLRNTNYIFAVLSDSEVKASLKDDVFMIVMYYLNKLLAVRTDSVQKKLTGLFKNNSGCQNLFSKFYQYLKNYQNKINKGMLRSFLSKQKYTDELSPKSFYVDKNLEKQIIEFFRLTCKNGNSFMQNYMKKQYNNSKSFNMVSLVNDFTKEFLTHLNYPVAYDTFNTCLKCILEFIQGPNETNQNIFIINDFVPNVAELILDMDYKNKDYEKDVSNDPADRFNVSNNSITVKSQRPLQSSISVGKSGFKRVSEQNVARPSTNYMISLSKFRVLSILNHLLDGFEATDYVYYLYRRVLSPAIFRKNFAYQQYFFSKSCGTEYDTNLFFKFYQNFDKKNKSPFVIEIGFECYFLLKKMEDNFKVDFDETYHKK